MEAAAAAYLAICAAYNGSASGLKKHAFYKFVVVSGRVYNHVIALSHYRTIIPRVANGIFQIILIFKILGIHLMEGRGDFVATFLENNTQIDRS